MKRWIPFGAIIVLCLVAILTRATRQLGLEPSSRAVLTVAGEAERELSRIPAHLDRMSDGDEIRMATDFARSYDSDGKYADQPAETLELRRLSRKRVWSYVAAHARRKLPYRFH